jgi:hypothetical protein
MIMDMIYLYLMKKYVRKCWECKQEYQTNVSPREPFWGNVTIASEKNFLCPNCYNKLIKLLKLNG